MIAAPTASEPVTPEVKAFFDANGYWLGPKVFEPDELHAMADAQDEVNAGKYQTGVPPMELGCDHPGIRGSVRKIDGCHVSNDVLRAAATTPALGEIGAALLGLRGLRLWHDQLLYKPPGGKAVGNVAWHQDFNYWRCSDTTDMITAWIPFHDADLEIGTMEFVAGSHQWGWNANFSFGFDTDREAQQRIIEANMPAGAKFRTALCKLKAGHVSFHHCLTLHSSGPNHTNRPRRSLVVHMQSVDCRWDPANADFGHMCVDLMKALGKKPGDKFQGHPWPEVWSA